MLHKPKNKIIFRPVNVNKRTDRLTLTTTALREFGFAVDTKAKTFMLALEGSSKRAGMLDNAFSKMAATFLTPEAMADVKENAAIKSADRAMETGRAKAATSLQGGMAKLFSEEIIQNIMSTNRAAAAGQGAGQIVPKKTLQASQRLSAEFADNMTAINNAFGQGEVAFGAAVDAFQNRAGALMKKAEEQAAGGIGAQQGEADKRLRLYRNLQSKVNVTIDQYRRSILLLNQAQVIEIQNIKVKTQLDKLYMDQQRKLSIGGGMDKLINTTQGDFADALRAITGSKAAGDLGGGMMAKADMLQGFGVVISDSMKEAMVQPMKQMLDDRMEMGGMEVTEGSTEDVVRSMIDARYKSDKGTPLERHLAAWEKVLNPVEKSNRALADWLSGGDAPWVNVKSMPSSAAGGPAAVHPGAPTIKPATSGPAATGSIPNQDAAAKDRYSRTIPGGGTAAERVRGNLPSVSPTRLPPNAKDLPKRKPFRVTTTDNPPEYDATGSLMPEALYGAQFRDRKTAGAEMSRFTAGKPLGEKGSFANTQQGLKKFMEKFKETFGSGGILEKGTSGATFFNQAVDKLGQSFSASGLHGDKHVATFAKIIKRFINLQIKNLLKSKL